MSLKNKIQEVELKLGTPPAHVPFDLIQKVIWEWQDLCAVREEIFKKHRLENDSRKRLQNKGFTKAGFLIKTNIKESQKPKHENMKQKPEDNFYLNEVRKTSSNE